MLYHEFLLIPQKPGMTVVVTCHGPCPELNVAIHSLLFQECYRGCKPITPVATVNTPIDIIISSDGPYEGPQDLLRLPNVRLLENPKEGGVGHHTRGPGINIANQDWILLTNADNYYAAGWLDQVTQQMADDVGVIYWNHINSLNGYGYFETNIHLGRIDLGCLAIRTHIARTIGFPFRRYSGDWDYTQACVKECLKAGLRIIKIPQILFVHN